MVTWGPFKKAGEPIGFFLKLCVFLLGGHPCIVLLAFWTLRCQMLTRAGEVLQQSKQDPEVDAAIPAVWAVGFTSGWTLSRTCCSHQQLHVFVDTLAVFSPPLHSGLSTVTGFCFGVPSWWALFSTLEEHIVSGIALALGFAQLVYTKARARLRRLGYELSCVCVEST